jgi:hypothetical protein
LLSVTASGVVSEYTNLPDSPPGVFSCSARVEIQSTVAAAWETLTNFTAYPEWNPFVREAKVIDPLGLRKPEQRPVEDSRLFFRVQIPALPLPVNSDTPDNPLHTQISYENVTHVQPELGRVAWRYHPDGLLHAERWQALSDIGDGKVLYESREVFSGALAGTIKTLMEENLQKSFAAQAAGFKLRLEGTTSP